MKRALVGIVGIGIGIGACSSDGGSPPSDQITDSVTKLCAKAFECKSTYPGMPADFTTVYGANEGACVMQSSPPMALEEALDASVAAGRIAFSSDNASACNAFITGLACNTSMTGFWGAYELPASCEMTLVGKVKLGDACTLWQDDGGNDHDVGDCADPNECSLDTSTCAAQ